MLTKNSAVLAAFCTDCDDILSVRLSSSLAFVDDTYKGKGSANEREKLGLSNGKKGKSASSTPPPESMNAMQQVEVHFVYAEFV